MNLARSVYQNELKVEERMHNQETEVLAIEGRFFNALISLPSSLDCLLTDDCLLIDVLSGSEVTKPDLLNVLESGQLKFDIIEPLGSRIRFYDCTAVVTGSTRMSGRFGPDPFSVHSRYTHVYVRVAAREWQLASAQGTSIQDSI